jgi:hypothetical protein
MIRSAFLRDGRSEVLRPAPSKELSKVGNRTTDLVVANRAMNGQETTVPSTHSCLLRRKVRLIEVGDPGSLGMLFQKRWSPSYAPTPGILRFIYKTQN